MEFIIALKMDRIENVYSNKTADYANVMMMLDIKAIENKFDFFCCHLW